MAEQEGALSGLVVIDLSTTVASAYTTQLFADFGAEVIQIEPLDGSHVRNMAAWPFWLRGKKSIALDLRDAADVEVAKRLIAGADVVVEAWGPGVAARLGLDYDQVKDTNPALVYTSISGFGHSGPFSHLQDYEAIVMAKTGSMYGSTAPDRPGEPVMVNPLGATMSASFLAMHGALVALHERERSGFGQRVDATMAQGMMAQDPWFYFVKVIIRRFGDAFTSGPAIPGSAIPQTWLTFGLVNGYSKDGKWMQFAHATPRQFDDFMRVLGLDEKLKEPEWKDAPNHEDEKVRDAWWTMMLEIINSKTIDEWTEVFDREPNVFAEQYRVGRELFDHPQIVYGQHAVEVENPVLGKVREMGPLVQMSKTPANATRAVPELDEHGPELRANPPAPKPTPTGTPDARPPLDGVTVVDLGTFYAGPFGSAMLADQGARVIKVEPLDGDPIRFNMPMPETAGVRVTQGKESIALDAFSEEGRKILTELVKKADLVLHCYRGGVAERMGLDAETVLKLNPNVMYHHGVGYGADGPYARRAAFAPTIAAGSGFAARSGGGGRDLHPTNIDEIKRDSLKLAGVPSGHPDGMAALGVAVGLSLDLVARDRGHGGQVSLTSMMSTMGHVLADGLVEYDGSPHPPVPDPEQYGYHALYRLYQASDGWVVLCAPTEHMWAQLGDALDIHDDERFKTAHLRLEHDDELIALLTERFKGATAREWEKELSAAGVGCAEVAPSGGPLAVAMFEPGNIGEEMGWMTQVTHPLFDEHPRTTELVSLSRSGASLRPGCTIGEHTKAVLAELGYDEAAIDELVAKGVIAP
jgi:crotonobetainyl-CoA:carnitine CoA-transferase CaiB-like acyl-CoA transferase